MDRYDLIVVGAGTAGEAAAHYARSQGASVAIIDRDLFGGHVEDAFARLVDLVRATSGDDRARVRTRLLELFDVIGSEDPRVASARVRLANALF